MSQTILIVNDETRVIAYVRSILVRAGYKSLEADIVQEGLMLLRTINVALVITDLVMPDADGIEFIEDIRRSHPDVKMIAISGALKATSSSLPRLLELEQL